MKKLDTLCDTAAKKIVQHTLQNAMEGGHNCPCIWFYQPHRPEKPLPKPQDKKKISRCSSKPVASQMRRAFLCLLLEKFTKSSNN